MTNIAFWGNLYPLKGIDNLIKAFSISNNKDSHLYIIGDSPYKKEYMSLVTLLGLRKKITFTGRLDHKNLSPLANSVDFCIFPSIHEAFGNMVLEAMACKKPVITLNNGGPKDIITDGKEGFLVNTKNPKEISEKINILLRDTKLRERMGNNAYSTVQKFRIEEIGEKYKKLYSDLLK